MRTGLDGALAVTVRFKGLVNPKDEDDNEREYRTYRTSIVRASDDANRARSFSKPGGSTGIAVLPFAPAAAAAADKDCRSSSGSCCRCWNNRAEWIEDWGALSGRRRAVKRFGGRAKASVYSV